MKLPSMWRIIVCCTLFLFNGSLPHAQVGKLEDVILAAKSDVEPPYIGELLTVLQQKLLGFVKQQPNLSETDEFALLFTMWGLMKKLA